MNVDTLCQYYGVRSFYHVLHDPLKPTQRSIQGFVDATNEAYYITAYEYTPKKYKFLLFRNQLHYLQLYKAVDRSQQCFYSVYCYGPRFLYLDLEIFVKKLSDAPTRLAIAKLMVSHLSTIFNTGSISLQCEYTKQIKGNTFVVFDNSRQQSKSQSKLSFHIFNKQIVWTNLDSMLQNIRKIKDYFRTVNTFNLNNHNMRMCLQILSGIDTTVYSKCQFFRLCNCIKRGEMSSRKRLILPTLDTLNHLQQVNINQADDCINKQKQWLPMINQIPHASGTITTLKRRTITENSTILCTSIEITNDKCYTCVSSNNYLARYTFLSTTNTLEWQEHRCLNTNCIFKTYTSLNNDIQYPRCFSNIPLPISELEQINKACKVFQLKISDSYKFIFQDNKISHEWNKSYILYFTRNIKCQCEQHPILLYAKNEKHRYLSTDGKYTYQCNNCKRFHNINNYTH